MDIQELLRIFQFRYGRKVGFRPVAVRRGVRFYPVEGKLCSEMEIVGWTEGGRTEKGSKRP
jgi:hypothetical protein